MIEVLQELEEFTTFSVTLRMLLATIFGGLIGLERGSKGRAAGLRTFALVSLGASVAMITNEYLAIKTGHSGDPSRMAAQVISGIGFLGAGMIIVTGRKHVIGLTTASGLWTTATMGIAIGAGFIWGGIISFFFIFVTIRALQYVSRRQEEFNRHFEIYIEVEGRKGYAGLISYIHNHNYRIYSIEKKKQKPIFDDDIGFIIEMDLRKRVSHQIIMKELHEIEFIHYIEEIG